MQNPGLERHHQFISSLVLGTASNVAYKMKEEWQAKYSTTDHHGNRIMIKPKDLGYEMSIGKPLSQTNTQ